MSAVSAGLLLYRGSAAATEVLLVHPGGPLWARKDAAAWSIPKGLVGAGETPLAAAIRECHEELGTPIAGEFVPLQPRRQPGGKWVHAWAVRADFDPATLRSNTFEIEWPPRSGRRQTYPEVDRAEWFPLAIARVRVLAGQRPFLDELEAYLRSTAG
jgi:predicted NUDIX family NTP pyrophosphohydrolase